MGKMLMFAVGAALALTVGQGAAAANPDLVGQPYGDAASALDDAGMTVVIGTVVGNELPIEECIVTNVREVSAVRPAVIDEDYPQFADDDAEVQVNLNCDLKPARAGTR